MKTERRWIASVLRESAKNDVTMPWSRKSTELSEAA